MARRRTPGRRAIRRPGTRAGSDRRRGGARSRRRRRTGAPRGGRPSRTPARARDRSAPSAPGPRSSPPAGPSPRPVRVPAERRGRHQAPSGSIWRTPGDAPPVSISARPPRCRACARLGLRALDRDPLEHVRDRLARVDRASSVSKMSFQRISIIGSMPFANRPATAARWSRSASFSSRWISTRCGAKSAPLRSPRSAGGDLLGATDEHVGHLLRLLHRRLDAVEAELVGRLLGEVDDVVERARERVDVGGVQRARAGARCPPAGAGCRGRSGRPPARTAGCRAPGRPARDSP